MAELFVSQLPLGSLITNNGGDLVVQREARYLVPDRGVSPQRTLDYAYGWGMNWTPGRK